MVFSWGIKSIYTTDETMPGVLTGKQPFLHSLSFSVSINVTTSKANNFMHEPYVSAMFFNMSYILT